MYCGAVGKRRYLKPAIGSERIYNAVASAGLVSRSGMVETPRLQAKKTFRSRKAMCHSGGPFALSNFSGSATITSEYIFHGISETDDNPAVQGSFQYSHPVGFYAGVWGSNVADYVSEGSVEIDLYAGFMKEIAESLTSDLSVEGGAGFQPRSELHRYE
jgi:hypothetical protein